MPPLFTDDDADVIVEITGGSRTDGVELREDGSAELREDGSVELRELN